MALTTHDCNSSLSLSSVQGIAQIKNEVEDLGEPLIDGIHGHGRYAPCMRISIFQRNSLKVASSHLAWTLIFAVKVWSTYCWQAKQCPTFGTTRKKSQGSVSTAFAVTHFERFRNCVGYSYAESHFVVPTCLSELPGVTKQPTVGFLTQLEHLRYCEVRKQDRTSKTSEHPQPGGWQSKNHSTRTRIVFRTAVLVLFAGWLVPEKPGVPDLAAGQRDSPHRSFLHCELQTTTRGKWAWICWWCTQDTPGVGCGKMFGSKQVHPCSAPLSRQANFVSRKVVHECKNHRITGKTNKTKRARIGWKSSPSPDEQAAQWSEIRTFLVRRSGISWRTNRTSLRLDASSRRTTPKVSHTLNQWDSHQRDHPAKNLN